MQEYYFPSGIPVTSFDAAPWIKALEIIFAALLIVALGVFLWRCCRPVVLQDVYLWLLFVGAEWLIASGATQYFQAVQDRFSPWQVWTPALLGTFALTFVAVNATVLRDFHHRGYSGFFLILEAIILYWVFAPGLGHPREASYRTRCKNNLQQIGLALHNYHDVWNTLPAAGGMLPDGDQRWTWRVAILPWIDQLPLSKEFHLDEPWDSPHNATLQERCPDVYRCPSHPIPKRCTSYAMLRGPHTIGGDGVTPVKMKEITDGTSNTFLVVEACGREIVWTEPKDVEVTENSLGVNLPGPQPGRSRGILSSYHAPGMNEHFGGSARQYAGGGAHVLLGDGTVRFVNEKIDPTVLKILTTRNGDELTPNGW